MPVGKRADRALLRIIEQTEMGAEGVGIGVGQLPAVTGGKLWIIAKRCHQKGQCLPVSGDRILGQEDDDLPFGLLRRQTAGAAMVEIPSLNMDDGGIVAGGDG